ncbi:maleylpyruvate isomerase family mycothiol-dependent enzyme [Amycolatopsis sp. lyj-90]|uniref:maleylpyruvate isomerase family mycothiol-dependent enzyme n=1 Tax=Amycolatopsis sp. lyj-90 TaxID=2789285 RepID=UPI00397DA20D
MNRETTRAWVRDGTAVFLRAVGALTESGFDAPSALPGWRRREVVAHVGCNARALGRLAYWGRTGEVTPMYSSPRARAEEIEQAATVPAEALSYLARHSAADLESTWDELPERAWGTLVRSATGRELFVSETCWLRAREVWIHSADLDAGITFASMPRDFLDTLIGDVLTSRMARGEEPPTLVDVATGRVRPGPGADEVFGSAPSLARWLTGRGDDGVRRADGGPLWIPEPWI